MAIKVKVPNENFDGERGGVKFEKGIGVFEDEKVGRELAASFGYEVIEEKKAAKKEAPKEEEKEAPKKTTRRNSRKKSEDK
ncbi:hypothetical protein [Terrihalobacillus insolitus]|uniref:hypothetical protein n=1 Tax=Terrihalobacillus insolitus TaxID=2950438 RepID=UPI0023419E81|nr:hypothetical protein [Terrihalobacillus insolitus]MDC3413966.1 hypothetical protein [Terrihalobacillus insolitus]